MRAAVITRPGPPDVLEVQDVDAPTAGAGEVLVDVAACGLNRADTMQRQGHYPPPPGASPYPGMECSGTICALGDAVTGWRIGDPVCALLSGGGYAEQVAVPAGQLMPVPAGVSLVDAAALPEVTCTVWSMVFRRGRLAEGEWFLVHGGSSGIGTLAIQLAHVGGARVIATAGSSRKLDVCRSLGADVAVNYKEDDFVAAVDTSTSGHGVDVILDNIGAKYLARNLSALATEGRLVVLGLQGGTKAELDLGAVLAKRATVTAATLRSRPAVKKAEIVTDTVANVWPLIEDGRVRPVIDRVFPFDQAARAHELMESSDHIGKILLQVR